MPFAYGFDGHFVEAVTEASNYLNSLRASIPGDFKRYQD
jgi:hypothetical protein